MKLDLTPEQAFFHGTTRQFLDDKVPTSLVRELRSDPAGFGRDFDLNTGPWTLELVTGTVTEDTLKEYSRPAEGD